MAQDRQAHARTDMEAIMHKSSQKLGSRTCLWDLKVLRVDMIRQIHLQGSLQGPYCIKSEPHSETYALTRLLFLFSQDFILMYLDYCSTVLVGLLKVWILTKLCYSSLDWTISAWFCKGLKIVRHMHA